MNEARRRRQALQSRLAEQRKAVRPPAPAPISTDLEGQLKASIAKVEAEKKMPVCVYLKGQERIGGDRFQDMVFMRISREHPTQDIEAMRRNGFWTEQWGRPVYIPAYSILKVYVSAQ